MFKYLQRGIIMSARPKLIPVNGVRKRIWDLYSGYHCCILGTCLNRNELRKLAQKKFCGLNPASSDFILHTNLVNMAGDKSAGAKALHRLLDCKYHNAVLRYGKIKGDDAIESLWEMDCKRGAIAGALWAIMTHLSPSQDLVHRIYGQVHMLGHDSPGDFQHYVLQINELHNKNSILQEVLVSERQQYLRQQGVMEEEMAELRMVQQDYTALVRTNERLARENKSLQTAVRQEDNLDKIYRLKKEIYSLTQDVAIQYGMLDTTNTELALANQTIADQKHQNTLLANKNSELEHEVFSLESALVVKISSSDCANCAEQQAGHCPGPDLCGKKILYVGGLKNMVPHYQQLIENFGGQFMHHDGGVEAARNQLPKMLGSADVVFCPVDCVSHDACTCVKKMCKYYQKPFVMMRSSGLSTLAKELGNITQ
jgi:hypothetical protein